jgi:hypothetical protein
MSLTSVMESHISTSMYSIPKGRIGPGTGYKYSPLLDSLLSPLKNDYVYSPIEHQHEIRLLRLLPGRDDDPIQCALVPHILSSDEQNGSSRVRYEALSYHWGSDEPTNLIRIQSVRRRTDGVGRHRISLSGFELRRFYVRSNLFAALQHLRLPNSVRVLWIDALCIDQANTKERNDQVARMAHIYGDAAEVCVWLGNAADSSKEAFAFIDRVLDIPRLDKLVKDVSTVPEWHALTNLMRRTWFSRRWVVQELALAKNASIHCGEDVVDWRRFANAVGLFDLKFDEIVQLFVESQQMRTEIESMFYVRALSGAYRLVDVLSNLFRRSADGQIKERLFTLEDLVLKLPSFQAKDPRDTIYALLALAKDFSPSPSAMNSFVVDYQKGVVPVFKDFIAFSIRMSGSLDIICRHWAPAANERLPSWISPVTNSPLGLREDSNYVRLNADSLVDQGYAASRKTRAEVYFGADIVIYGEDSLERQSTLYVRGFRVDTIVHICKPADQGYIRGEWFEIGCPSNILVPEPFWRTLVADRGTDGKGPPAWYSLACLHVLNERKAGHLNISEQIERMRPLPENIARHARRHSLTIDRGLRVEIPSEARLAQITSPVSSPRETHQRTAPAANETAPNINGASINVNPPPQHSPPQRPPPQPLRQTSEATVKFLERVQRVAWDRRFFITKDKQSMGLAPAHSQKGDLVCILFGCSVPVILRPQGRFPNDYYQLIGECFVYGMMDGESMDSPAGQRTEIFTLR